MNSIKLQSTLDDLSKVIDISEEKKKELITRYSTSDEKEVIKDLLQGAYSILREKTDLYNQALTIIRNINPEICPPIEEVKERLKKMFSNEVEGNMSLEENHQLINESLVQFTTLFNQNGIDYYIVGALPCFIKTGQQLFRYHDDIDIMVNEDDIPKLAEIIQSSGYEFHDDRFPSLERFKEMEENKPPHTVLAQNPDNEFHLGFFTFRREQDNSMTVRGYTHRLEDGRVVVDVSEGHSDKLGTELRYDDTPTEYMGTSFKTSTVEHVYSLKEYTRRPKDIIDVQKLDSFIDRTKLELLKEHPNENKDIHDIEIAANKKKDTVIEHVEVPDPQAHVEHRQNDTINTFVEVSPEQVIQIQSLGNAGQDFIGGMGNSMSAPSNLGSSISGVGRLK